MDSTFLQQQGSPHLLDLLLQLSKFLWLSPSLQPAFCLPLLREGGCSTLPSRVDFDSVGKGSLQNTALFSLLVRAGGSLVLPSWQPAELCSPLLSP